MRQLPHHESRLATHNQTSIEQGDIPAPFGQSVLKPGPEDANPISGVFPTSGDYLQGIVYGLHTN